MQENPEDIITAVDEVSPLRSLVVETHEVYQELLDVGFPSAVSAQIVAGMLSLALAMRGDEDDEDEDEYDDPEI